ncbi:MAG: serine/threonine protein kinase, partial [Planctomycetes bacterium]|nr:serine/threonine protein kinase [Planctomycetota bacterium]
MGTDLQPDVRKGTAGAADQRLVGYHTDALLFEAVLGSGAMGVVYRGRQVRLDRLVAIKVIAAHLAGDPAYVDRFNREARTLARLHHPGIVACYDFGPLPGPAGETLLIMVMEFVDGSSLGDLLKSRPMGVRAVLELHRQAAEGLAAAHYAGVVHRDIKPDNIMVTRDGLAKITDFGLAKCDDNASLTQVGLLMGTPAYMAPEVCAGGVPTPSSDLYSLGCALYAALVGEVPYPSPSSLESIQLHLKAPVPAIAGRRPELAMLDGLLRRLLAKAPGERCASAQQLAKELATVIPLVPEQLMCGRRPAKAHASNPDLQTVMQSAATIAVPADQRLPPSRRTVSQLLPVVHASV